MALPELSVVPTSVAVQCDLQRQRLESRESTHNERGLRELSRYLVPPGAGRAGTLGVGYQCNAHATVDLIYRPTGKVPTTYLLPTPSI